MSETPLAFVDCETTGLDPDMGHELWEVAVIVGKVRALYQVRPNLANADSKALEIGGFHDRFKVPEGHEAARIDPDTGQVDPTTVAQVRGELVRLLNRAVMIGSNPGFDAAFIKRLLLGATPWHYRPVDAITLAVGKLGSMPMPWRSEDISRAVGVESPDKTSRHTAMGDALWIRDVFHAAIS